MLNGREGAALNITTGARINASNLANEYMRKLFTLRVKPRVTVLEIMSLAASVRANCEKMDNDVSFPYYNPPPVPNPLFCGAGRNRRARAHVCVCVCVCVRARAYARVCVPQPVYRRTCPGPRRSPALLQPFNPYVRFGGVGRIHRHQTQAPLPNQSALSMPTHFNVYARPVPDTLHACPPLPSSVPLSRFSFPIRPFCPRPFFNPRFPSPQPSPILSALSSENQPNISTGEFSLVKCDAVTENHIIGTVYYHPAFPTEIPVSSF